MSFEKEEIAVLNDAYRRGTGTGSPFWAWMIPDMLPAFSPILELFADVTKHIREYEFSTSDTSNHEAGEVVVGEHVFRWEIRFVNKAHVLESHKASLEPTRERTERTLLVYVPDT